MAACVVPFGDVTLRRSVLRDTLADRSGANGRGLYLRAGATSLRLLLEDVYGGRFARVVREIEVPSPEGLPPVASVVTV